MHEWGPYEFTLWSDKEFPGSSWKTPGSDRGFPGEDLDFETSVYQVVDVFNRRHLGGALMLAGTAMLVPGPIDAVAGALGFAAGGPYGAVAGVALYNLAGVAMLVGGAYLVGESFDYPDVHWDRLSGRLPDLGASPMVSVRDMDWF